MIKKETVDLMREVVGFKEFSARLNMVILLADVQHTYLVECNEDIKRINRVLKEHNIHLEKQDTHDFNLVASYLRKAKALLAKNAVPLYNNCESDDCLDEADELAKLLFLINDRTWDGEDYHRMYNTIYNLFRSRLGMAL